MVLDIFLYISLFFFGYMTCFLFYFGKSINIYMSLTKSSLLLSLFIIVRSLEHYSYAKEARLITMKKNGCNEKTLKAIEDKFNQEINFFKESYVKDLCEAQDATPYYRHFESWATAMDFLESNKNQLNNFIIKHKQTNKGR